MKKQNIKETPHPVICPQCGIGDESRDKFGWHPLCRTQFWREERAATAKSKNR